MTTASEMVAVDPLAPALAPTPAYGLLNNTTALNLGAAVRGLAGDASALSSLTVSAIPVGPTLSDGTNSFTASSGSRCGMSAAA